MNTKTKAAAAKHAPAKSHAAPAAAHAAPAADKKPHRTAAQIAQGKAAAADAAAPATKAIRQLVQISMIDQGMDAGDPTTTPPTQPKHIDTAVEITDSDGNVTTLVCGTKGQRTAATFWADPTLDGVLVVAVDVPAAQ